MRKHEFEIDGKPYCLAVAQDAGGDFVGDVVIVPMTNKGRVSVRYPDGFVGLPIYPVKLTTRVDLQQVFGINAVQEQLKAAESDLRRWSKDGWLQETSLRGPD